jgi:8-oxo-dGTP diphosphatase
MSRPVLRGSGGGGAEVPHPDINSCGCRLSDVDALIPGMHEVVVGALVCEGRVLLVHRSSSRRAYPNVWDLPGGHIERGESERRALARELHEELGIQAVTGSLSHLCRLSAGHGAESLLLSAWLVGDWHGTPENVAPDEHDEIRWFRPEELPPLAHEPVAAALADAMRIRRT